MNHSQQIIVNTEECYVNRYDVLAALMKASQSHDKIMQLELSNLLRKMILKEQQTREYVKTINVKISENEELLKYINEI